jgi:hypothetical protein
MYSHKFLTFIKILFGLVFFLLLTYLSGFYRWVDINFFGEKIKDATGRYLFHEDWSSISLVHHNLDYSWITDDLKPILIAHALGASGTSSQNKLTEMNKSIKNGLRLMEVDIWLDDSGQIRCHHGPESPSPFKKGDCTFEEVLSISAKNQIWMVLDIKTDFQKTGEEIVKRTQIQDAAHVIFQLYKPEHVEMFSRWHSEKPFAGPIVTLYLARRSINYVQKKMHGTAFKALTIPSHRLAAINFKSDNIKIFTHPVHNCNNFRNLKKYKLDGFYVINRTSKEIEAGCL